MSQKAGTAFMNKSITPNQIKQNNKSLIYHYIYQNPKVSQQDIAYDLRLSRPTITTNLNALEADGFIQRDGQITTESAGRKAVLLDCLRLPRCNRCGSSKAKYQNHRGQPVWPTDRPSHPFYLLRCKRQLL